MNQPGPDPDAMNDHRRSITIRRELRCIGCGYILRSLTYADPCPECGTLVQQSDKGDLLIFADIPWLQRMRTAVVLITWALLTSIAADLAIVAAESWGTPRSIEILQLAKYLISFPLGLRGLWQFSARPPNLPMNSDATDSRNRLIMRHAIAPLALTIVLMLSVFAFGLFSETSSSKSLSNISQVCLYFATLIGVLLFVQYAREVASRSSSPDLSNFGLLILISILCDFSIMLATIGSGLTSFRDALLGGSCASACSNDILWLFLIVHNLVLAKTLSDDKEVSRKLASSVIYSDLSKDLHSTTDRRNDAP